MLLPSVTHFSKELPSRTGAIEGLARKNEMATREDSLPISMPNPDHFRKESAPNTSARTGEALKYSRVASQELETPLYSSAPPCAHLSVICGPTALLTPLEAAWKASDTVGEE